MICILSQSSLEVTTEAVIDWLRSWGIPFVRINGTDIDSCPGPTFSINNEDSAVWIFVDGVPINAESIKVVWYRRWAHNHHYRQSSLFAAESHRDHYNFLEATSHFGSELRAVSSFFFRSLDGAEWLGHPSTSVPNKLQVLSLARQAGLDIPDTLVTNDVDNARQFAAKHGQIITKPVGDVLSCAFDGRPFGTYTNLVPASLLDPAEENCWRGSFPSLFQEKLEKKYEIRSFYLDGRFYGMAMFTQTRPSTKVDFRKYSWADPVRTVPYKLPDETEAGLRELMDRLRLDTGSIDMVRTTDGRTVFLEINPVGQFGMVSIPCNYHLEREVASALAGRMNGKREKN
ncbi:MAG TPA: grasp-with-spasm system ATP-grasp peptide maturase [Blastocatellia bacterium]|nr:grasp-with-spasm system ATP-grasp peptide maturase [Blastocatellia bacterium]